MKTKHDINGFVYYSNKMNDGYQIEFDSGAAVARVETVNLTEEEFELIQKKPSEFYSTVIAAMNRTQQD